MINVTLNGEKKMLESQCSVEKLLQNFVKQADNCIVEINRMIVGRDFYATTMIKDGDTIELVRFIGGG